MMENRQQSPLKGTLSKIKGSSGVALGETPSGLNRAHQLNYIEGQKYVFPVTFKSLGTKDLDAGTLFSKPDALLVECKDGVFWISPKDASGVFVEVNEHTVKDMRRLEIGDVLTLSTQDAEPLIVDTQLKAADDEKKASSVSSTLPPLFDFIKPESLHPLVNLSPEAILDLTSVTRLILDLTSATRLVFSGGGRLVNVPKSELAFLRVKLVEEMKNNEVAFFRYGLLHQWRQRLKDIHIHIPTLTLIRMAFWTSKEASVNRDGLKRKDVLPHKVLARWDGILCQIIQMRKITEFHALIFQRLDATICVNCGFMGHYGRACNAPRNSVMRGQVGHLIRLHERRNQKVRAAEVKEKEEIGTAKAFWKGRVASGRVSEEEGRRCYAEDRAFARGRTDALRRQADEIVETERRYFNETQARKRGQIFGRL